MSDTWPKKPIQRPKKVPRPSLNMVFLSPTSALSHSPRQKPISNLIQFFETTVCTTQKTKKKKKSPVTHQPPSTADPYQQTPSDFRHRFLCRCYTLSPASSGFLWCLGEREREREREREISEIWRTELGLVWMSLGLGLKAQPTITPTLFCFSFFLIFFKKKSLLHYF